MFKIGDYTYKLCLLDTNSISFILRHEVRFNKILNRYPFPEYLYAFSPYVLFELSKNNTIFEKFKSRFGSFPNILLKSERELFREEIKRWIDNSYEIKPWSLFLASIDENIDGRNKIDLLFLKSKIKNRFIQIDSNIKESYVILNEWADWAKKYTLKREKIKYRIVEAFCISQIYYFDPGILAQRNIKINFKDYPSICSLGYSWYYKFVSDYKRKTSVNDIVDIFNISAIEYCDLFIGENNMVDIVNKMKKKNIIHNIEVAKASELL